MRQKYRTITCSALIPDLFKFLRFVAPALFCLNAVLSVVILALMLLNKRLNQNKTGGCRLIVSDNIIFKSGDFLN